MNTAQSLSIRSTRTITSLAWIVLLFSSMLPNIFWHELVNPNTRWLFWAKIVFLAVMIAASFAWQGIRSLRNFFVVLLSIFLAEEFFGWVGSTALWRSWFGSGNAGFTTDMMGIQLLRLGVALTMIAMLLLIGYRRKDFFLRRGKLDAPITPVRWLGFPKAEPWTRFGGQFAIYISLGLLLFLVLAARPSLSAVGMMLPLLPAVILFAVMNAFNEEMTYRASMLAPLEGPLGSKQALWMTAAFFGIGHYFGVPYGIIGVVMSTFLGWFLGKAMLETRGFFWAWFIHFLQDVLIFSFMAIGSIAPGG